MTNPAVARKKPSHARSPKPTVNLGSFISTDVIEEKLIVKFAKSKTKLRFCVMIAVVTQDD